VIPTDAPAALEDGAPVLEGRRIGKTFAGVVANADVDFVVRRGEIHALLGENGAGKTTLASILTGLYQPDAGTILVAGRAVRLRSPRDGLALRLGMVHQHFHLVESFTVAENVVLGDPHQRSLLSRRVHQAVASLGEEYGLTVDPHATIADLSLGERQRVEIVKMLYRNVDALFLDEPTAVLTPQEVDSLFTILRAMAADGRSVVLITHKLGEVMAVANRVTVMRDARVVASMPTGSTATRALARLMVGRDVDLAARQSDRRPGKCVLAVEDLSVDGHQGRRVQHVDLTVRAGEIVGVAGVAGNGQLQLAETLAGLRRPSRGRIRVDGVDITGRGVRAARAAGLRYVPEDRLGTGLAPGLSIAENLQLTAARPLVASSGRANRVATTLMRRFGIKARGPWETVRRLSGGNIQRVLLARELTAGAPMLVVASPTRGLDVSGIEFVRGLLDERRSVGAAILLISEDLDEIRGLADRIVVMYDGRLVLERPVAGADMTEIGLAMAGVAVT
jgi:simple sugar transport system ATP-binding protein